MNERAYNLYLVWLLYVVNIIRNSSYKVIKEAATAAY